MTKNYTKILADLDDTVSLLSESIPKVMEGYSAMSSAAKAAGFLDKKTKELIAIAIGVAVKCDSCVASHVNTAARYGASREEISEALSVAVFMGGGPSVVYASQALAAFDLFTQKVE